MSKNKMEETLKKAGLTDKQVKDILASIKEEDGSIADCGEMPNEVVPKKEDEDLDMEPDMPASEEDDAPADDAEADLDVDSLMSDLMHNVADLHSIAAQLRDAQEADDDLNPDHVDDLLQDPADPSDEEVPADAAANQDGSANVEVPSSDDEPKKDDEDMNLPDDLTDPDKDKEEVGLPNDSSEDAEQPAEEKVKALEAENASLRSQLADERSKRAEEQPSDDKATV